LFSHYHGFTGRYHPGEHLPGPVAAAVMAFENESELPSGDNFGVAIILQDGTETDIVCSGMLERQVSGYASVNMYD